MATKSHPFCPVVTSSCADCGVGTVTLGEWYVVRAEIWEQAWAGRRKSWQRAIPGQEILCIGCLEKRIGRTLMRCDFTDAPINDLADDSYKSNRLRDRLTPCVEKQSEKTPRQPVLLATRRHRRCSTRWSWQRNKRHKRMRQREDEK
jgi:hypothetical protein